MFYRSDSAFSTRQSTGEFWNSRNGEKTSRLCSVFTQWPKGTDVSQRLATPISLSSGQRPVKNSEPGVTWRRTTLCAFALFLSGRGPKPRVWVRLLIWTCF